MAFRRAAAAFAAAGTLFVICMMAEGSRGIAGGRTEIAKVKSNEQVQELGKFSVEEYNRVMRDRKQSNGEGEVEFREVVAAEKQVVSGIKYYMKISASRNGLTQIFDSVVVDRPWLHSKQLVSFAPSSFH